MTACNSLDSKQLPPTQSIFHSSQLHITVGWTRATRNEKLVQHISLILYHYALQVFGKANANDPQALASNVTARSQTSAQHYKYVGVGKTFNVSASVLDAMEFPIPQSHLLPLDNMTVGDFVVVTATNHRYFGGVIHVILTVRQYLPTHRIILYDLGLNGDQVKEVREREK